MPENTSPTARRSNPAVFTLLVTAALAGAVLTGASLNGAVGVSPQDLLRGAGFGRNSEMVEEQHRQAQVLQEIERTLSRTRADIAQLNARVDEAENLYQEAVNAVPAGAAADNPNSANPVSVDLGALRSSFDEHAEHDRDAFRAVNRRLDWIEKLIYGPERTAQPAGTVPRRSQRHQFAQGRVPQAGKGVALTSGKGAAIDVTPGSSVPELGRIAAIRQERGGRRVVVTENGTTIRER